MSTLPRHNQCVMDADLQRNRRNVLRDTDKYNDVNAARIHFKSSNWGLLRSIAEYIHLAFPCKEYNSTETTVDFEFTSEIKLAEVYAAISSFDRVGKATVFYHVDAAQLPPGYTMDSKS